MPYSLLESEVRIVSPSKFPILRGKVGPRQKSQTRFPPLHQRRNGSAVLDEWSATFTLDYFPLARDSGEPSRSAKAL